MSSTIKRRTATIVIYQGDDLERLSELRREVSVTEGHFQDAVVRPRRGGDEDPRAAMRAAQRAFDAFVDEAAERAVEVHLQAMGRKPFRALLSEHPARQVEGADGKPVDHDDDVDYGANTETMFEPLMAASIIAPEFDSPAERQAFLDDLSDGDSERLFATAFWLNRSPGGDPKEQRFSSSTRSSTET